MKKALLFVALFICVCCVFAGAEGEPAEYRAVSEKCAAYKKDGEEIIIPAGAYTGSAPDVLAPLEDGSILTEEGGYLEYKVILSENSLYTLSLLYKQKENGGEIRRAVYINGELPFKEAQSLMLSRLWNDANRDYKNIRGNQPFPAQIETPTFTLVPLKDIDAYVEEPFAFPFVKGENILRISSEESDLYLKEIRLKPIKALPDYAEYLSAAQGKGLKAYAGEKILWQAEDASAKSGPGFYPINDRTSPATMPYHPSYITLNCIGGNAWNEPGEWLAWDVSVPEEGLYHIALRFRQSALRGTYATRSLQINGEIPFKEALDLRFDHSEGFRTEALHGAKTAFLFHLKKGINRITLEVSLGTIAPLLQDTETLIDGLNAVYRRIIAITGTAPDVNRNYQLFARLPELKKDIEDIAVRTESLYVALKEELGGASDRSAAFVRLSSVMNGMTGSEQMLLKNLLSFKECITALGKSVFDLKNRPLIIDYMMLTGAEDPDWRKGDAFLEGLKHSSLAFLGSFTNNYNVSGESQKQMKAKELNVWISSGRDQFEVIRRLINESFSAHSKVNINLNLISTDVLLPATFTGAGPEVALQIGNTAPVNFAMRGAALDLKTFADFNEVAKWFHPSALTSFEFGDGCYALPDQMSFPVMFYRKDILKQIKLEPPKTWEDLLNMIPAFQKENMEIYLDTAPPQSLGAYVSMGNSQAVNTVFLSRLYQTGGEIYNKDGSACVLSDDKGNLAFRWWTQFYTQHGFPRDIDFITRFRLGEVPLGIVDLSAYTRLAVSAPEIRNEWGIAQVPGTRQPDGTIKHDVPCVTGASMIIKTTAEKNGTKDEAWQFLKWWTSGETQTKYAREMEAVLGPSGRYQVANLDAYRTISWPKDIKKVLMDALSTLHGIPQVPGGYITGRYLNNAFLSVITNYEIASDVLFESTELINKEIDLKREEFGLPAATKTGGEGK